MNKTISLPYLDRLDNERQRVFHKLKPFADRFVLVGGTAIMLQIGHRMSYDFDCFSENDLPITLIKKAKRVFGTIRQKLKTHEIVQLATGEGIELHFVHYPYTHLQKPIRTDSLPLAHLDDLAANKAHTMGRRPAWRDYVDIFFLMKWRLYSLMRIIQLAEQKYADEFNDKLFLQQLTYFDDLDIPQTVFLKESYSTDEIKSFLSRETDQYVQKALGLNEM